MFVECLPCPDMEPSIIDRASHQWSEKMPSFSPFCRWGKRGTERLSVTHKTTELDEPGHLAPESTSEPL